MHGLLYLINALIKLFLLSLIFISSNFFSIKARIKFAVSTATDLKKVGRFFFFKGFPLIFCFLNSFSAHA